MSSKWSTKRDTEEMRVTGESAVMMKAEIRVTHDAGG